MLLHNLPAFLAACLLIAASPGPSTILIIRQSLRGGRRAGLPTVLGNESGVFFWGCAAALGLTALPAASKLAYDGMRIAVFALSFLPGFVPAHDPKLPTMVLLAALWATFEIGYYGCYVWFVDRMRSVVGRPSFRRRTEQISGVVLIGLGLRLAVEGV